MLNRKRAAILAALFETIQARFLPTTPSTTGPPAGFVPLFIVGFWRGCSLAGFGVEVLQKLLASDGRSLRRIRILCGLSDALQHVRWHEILITQSLEELTVPGACILRPR